MLGRVSWAGVMIMLACSASLAQAPAVSTHLCDTATGREAALRWLNARRAEGADCGPSGRFAAAAALQWDERLQRAADAHAAELALAAQLDHRSRDGRDGGARLREQGYADSRWAENLALGHADALAALHAWLASPLHCANLFNAEIKHVGLACRAPRADPARRVFVLDLARPR